MHAYFFALLRFIHFFANEHYHEKQMIFANCIYFYGKTVNGFVTNVLSLFSEFIVDH